jgi:hypothetical protein
LLQRLGSVLGPSIDWEMLQIPCQISSLGEERAGWVGGLGGVEFQGGSADMTGNQWTELHFVVVKSFWTPLEQICPEGPGLPFTAVVIMQMNERGTGGWW